MPPTARALVLMLLCAAWASCGRSSLTASHGDRGGSNGHAGTSGAAGTLGIAGTSGLAGTSGGTPDAGVDAVHPHPAACVTSECDGMTALRTCEDGQWGVTLMCPNFCFNGACTAECFPGTTDCTFLAGFVRVCNVDGIWGAPRPAGTECGMTSASKTVFVTSLTFQGGALGGLEGADAICGKLAAGAGLPGTFRAWLSDATGSPATRFTQDGGPYQLVNGTIISGNWKELTTLPLRHAIDLTEAGGPPPATSRDCTPTAVWTNTDNDGRRTWEGFDCEGWSDPTWPRAVFGSAESAAAWTDSCQVFGETAETCADLAALYCFQQ